MGEDGGGGLEGVWEGLDSVAVCPLHCHPFTHLCHTHLHSHYLPPAQPFPAASYLCHALCPPTHHPCPCLPHPIHATPCLACLYAMPLHTHMPYLTPSTLPATPAFAPLPACLSPLCHACLPCPTVFVLLHTTLCPNPCLYLACTPFLLDLIWWTTHLQFYTYPSLCTHRQLDSWFGLVCGVPAQCHRLPACPITTAFCACHPPTTYFPTPSHLPLFYQFTPSHPTPSGQIPHTGLPTLLCTHPQLLPLEQASVIPLQDLPLCPHPLLTCAGDTPSPVYP